MYLTKLLVLAVAIFCGSVMAQDHNEIVQTATSRYDLAFLENWSFHETRSTNDGVRVARYDPTRAAGGGWDLLSINGESPDENAVSDFLSEKAARKAEREESEGQYSLLEMITPGTIGLIEETHESWRFSFQPRDEEDAEFMEHVGGELRILKDGHYLESLTLRAHGPFKPQTGVKINAFEMQMRFGPAAEKGPIVPLSITSNVSGKAFLVAAIEEMVVVEFSDYQNVNQSDED